jgi:hypothetical protein
MHAHVCSIQCNMVLPQAPPVLLPGLADAAVTVADAGSWTTPALSLECTAVAIGALRASRKSQRRGSLGGLCMREIDFIHQLPQDGVHHSAPLTACHEIKSSPHLLSGCGAAWLPSDTALCSWATAAGAASCPGWCCCKCLRLRQLRCRAVLASLGGAGLAAGEQGALPPVIWRAVRGEPTDSCCCSLQWQRCESR